MKYKVAFYYFDGVHKLNLYIVIREMDWILTLVTLVTGIFWKLVTPIFVALVSFNWILLPSDITSKILASYFVRLYVQRQFS